MWQAIGVLVLRAARFLWARRDTWSQRFGGVHLVERGWMTRLSTPNGIDSLEQSFR